MADEGAVWLYRRLGFRPVGVMREYERRADGTVRDGLPRDMLTGDMLTGDMLTGEPGAPPPAR